MASSEDKMIDFHISRLKDRQAEVLLRTIEELLKFGAKAERALPALEAVYKSATDPNVKEAAHRAGRTIFFATKNGNEGAV
ncbi:MAG: hypothetical protein K8L91_00405 [Anaerolineae bacterium]|nr:hypothetical protein [Anaerolineae bacterium]